MRAGHTAAFGRPAIMWGSIERADDVVTVTLSGEFDLAARIGFGTFMREIEASGPREIVVNVRGLSFMDSTGVDALLTAHQRAVGTRSLVVLNGSGPAHRTLQLAGLDQVLAMVDDPSDLPDRTDSSPAPGHT